MKRLFEFTVYAPDLWEPPTLDEEVDLDFEQKQRADGQPVPAWTPDRKGYVTADARRARRGWWTYVVYAESFRHAYVLAHRAVMAPDRWTPGIRRCLNPSHGVCIHLSLDGPTRKGAGRKLSAEQVQEMLSMWAQRKERRVTQEQLARRFKISRSQVSQIVTRKRWKHLA